MGTNDSSNPAQYPLELVEILKRLGAHRRELHAQVFGKPQWTREQSDSYWHHPLVWACKWLEERVGGISRHELEHAAFRLTTPLGLKGMDPLPGPDEDFLTALEGNAKRELCELYDLMAADKTPPELKGQGKPVQLTEKQQAALTGLRPNCFQVISEEQAEALAQLPGRAVQPRRPTEGDPGMPDWLWMTGKFRELDRDGTTDRDSTTTRLWRQLSEKYPTILADAGIPVASQAPVVVLADPQKEIRAEALAAVVAGGFPGMIQAAVSLPAGDRISEVMRLMCESDEMYYRWSADNWVEHLKAAKKTVTGCDAWGEIMQWREAQKQSAMPVKSAMQLAESRRRKQHKKLAE